MPVYQYQGQHYSLPDGLSKDEAIGKIQNHINQQRATTLGWKDTPQAEEPSLKEKAVGVGEAALSTATGAVGGIASAITGVMAKIEGQDVDKQIEKTAGELTYSPKTEAGKAYLENVNTVLRESGATALMPGLAPEVGGISAALSHIAEKAVNPSIAKAVIPAVPDVATPAASYEGMASFRADAGIKAIKSSIASQDKIVKASNILEKYPEVQSATTGKASTIRKSMEKDMQDPEVLALIKKAQDTRAAFMEGEPVRPDEYKAGTGSKNLKYQAAKDELIQAINAGESHTTIKALKDKVDLALSDFHFPGVSREEASAWIEDMKARQKQSDTYIAEEEAKPKTIATAVQQGKRLSLKEPISSWDYRGKADARMIKQRTDAITELTPTEEKQAELFKAMEDPAKQNTPEVKAIRAHFDEVWNTGHSEGVVKDWVENYITHMYDYGTQAKSAAMNEFKKLVEEINRPITSGMTSRSRFGDKRVFKTYEEAAQKAGLKPLTTNPAELYQAYATSMLKAVNNKKFVAEIKDVVNPATGDKLLTKINTKTGIPRGYVTVNHPQLAGYAVAKDVAPTVKSMFETPPDSIIMSTGHLISMVAKKGIFSLSALHIKSLGDAFIGALRNPSMVTKIKPLMKQWKEGGEGDLVDLALKGGLEIGHMPIDVHADVLRGVVDDVSKSLDKAFPHLGETVRLPAKGIELLNSFLWEQVHPALKLATWATNHEQLVAKGFDPLKASEMAATFTNDVFGGLNWRRIAENTDSYLGYKVANEAASRGGQRAMQIGMLAPDWTIATARSWEGAFRKGANPAERAMYQRYLLQSALLYMGVADLLNQYFSGHNLWQNDDPTMVDMGDGRKLQLSKHFMEVPHWFLHPNQTLLNKLGYVPSELFRQALNQDYLSATGAAPKVVEKGTGLGKELEQRTAHLFKGMTPITLGTAAEKSPKEALASGLGFPVYGNTPEQRQALANARQQKMLEIKRKMAE